MTKPLIITTKELAIQIPALPRPTLAELQAKYLWIKSIERDTSPTEPVTLNLATVLRKNETSISGQEYERRLVSHQNVLLGYQHRAWLLKHQAEYPAFMALLGKIYVDFPGLVVVDEGGDRGVFFLYGDGGRWGLLWRCLSNDVYSNGRAAFSGKSAGTRRSKPLAKPSDALPDELDINGRTYRAVK